MLFYTKSCQIVRIALVAIFLSFGMWGSAVAQIIIPVQDQSRVDVTVNADVQFDSATGLYTYSYVVTSLATSVLEVATFAVEFDGELLDILAPPGWKAYIDAEKPVLDWSAVDLGDLPEGEVDDGNIPPSPFQIKPGETLGGFSFKSPEPPQTVTFFAQGYAPLPTTGEGVGDDLEVPLFEDNSFVAATIGPGLDDGIIFGGGRRPAVDGFLGFLGTENRPTIPSPVAITIRFSIHGETVNRSTFSAQLNHVDVTNSFESIGVPNELTAVFELGNSPVVTGRNSLVTRVEGIVPGTTRTATDGDSFTFFIE